MTTKEGPVTIKELDAQLDEIKKRHIKEILKSTPKKAEAARRLNIEPNMLAYFINKWGL